MKVLLTGATGFIGQRLLRRLLDAGHEVLCVGRHPPPSDLAGHPQCGAWPLDLAEAVTPSHWMPLLDGIDAVVNTVGIFREQGTQRFDVLHAEAPCALFTACAARGVQRVVQLSALGAAADAPTAYHRSKQAGDACLLVLPGLDAAVVRPSLVFGPDGDSSGLFLMLATLPLLVLPGDGRHPVQPVQPVHVDDLVQVLSVLLLAPPGSLQRLADRRIDVVGPEALSLAAYLQTLRAGLRLPPAPTLALPGPVTEVLARLGDHLPGSLFTRDSWAMLQQGNTAPAAETERLLARPPRAPTDFVPAALAEGWRSRARLHWLLPVLRLSIALVWLVTALVSAGLYPVAESRGLLSRAGVPGALQWLALYGAAALDLALGVLTLWPVGPGRWQLASRRWVWRSQALLIAAYTLVITVKLPEFWLHPYGPVLKNLPMLALLLLLDTFEPVRPVGGRRLP